ncbi:NudC domain-containing protein 2 [Aix galericulata]|nr:NudC domain-containing protein 2 [Aix galericulata]
MAAPFEERSGVVPCRTPWGRWYQTLEEVFVEVHVPPGTRAKDVSCSLQSRHLALAVGGRQLLQGKLFDSTIADEGTWTLEDRKLIRIVLMKTNRDAGNCWTSLLENDYAADPWVQDQMQRKLTLERFQREASFLIICSNSKAGSHSEAIIVCSFDESQARGLGLTPQLLLQQGRQLVQQLLRFGTHERFNHLRGKTNVSAPNS